MIKKNRSGFTLTELLVVVGVIAILSSMMIVGFEGAYDYAMRLRCQHTMEHLWTACVLYSTNHRNMLPPAVLNDKAWHSLLVTSGYLDSDKGATCPTSNLPTSATVGNQNIPNAIQLKEAQRKTLDYLKSVQNTSTGSWGGSQRGAVTSLCVLAFLGAGVTENHPVYGQTLAKGITYLTTPSYYTGGWWNQDSHTGYTQGLVLMALGDAVKYGRVERARATAVTALAPHIQRQLSGSYGGYAYSGSGTDMSVSAWAYQGIASCKNANMELQGATWAQVEAKAQQFFDASIRVNGMYDSYYQFTSGGGDRMNAANLFIRLLFCHKGEKPSWYTEPANYAFTTAPTPALTPATTNNERAYFQYRMMTRLQNGQTDRDHIRYIKNSWAGLRVGGPSSGCYDVYGAYYYTLAMYVYGGEDWRPYAEVISNLICNNWVAANGSVSGTYTPGGDTHFATALVALQIDALVGSNTVGSKYYVSGSHSFGYNTHIAGSKKAPMGNIIAFIDYSRATIASGDPESLLSPRHNGKNNVLFCDGHTEALYPEQLTRDGYIRDELLSSDKIR